MSPADISADDPGIAAQGAQASASLIAAQEAFARRRRLIPAIIGAALFMQTLDATIISNALPTMARSLHESPLTLNLAITSYLLSAAIFLPISGWMADRFGARRVFTAAIIAFAATSQFCGMAQNIETIVAARFCQGIAGAMMLPVGRLVLLKCAPKDQLVDALATLTMPALLGPVLGPPVGGFIVTFASWRWIFYLNVPVALLGVALVTLFVPDVREEKAGRLDVKGFLLTGLGLAGVVFGLQNLGRGVLPLNVVAALLIVGSIALGLYVFHARRTREPILDLSVLRIRTFFSSVVGGVFPRLMIGASPFLLALLLQMGFGMSAFAAGMTTFIGAAGALAMKTTAPPIIRRFGFRTVLIGNSFITGAIMMAYALFTPTTPHWLIMLALLIGGFFRSLHFTALNAMAFADVPQEKMSRASALSSMGQQLTQSIGVSLAALLIHGLMQVTHTHTISHHVIAPAFAIVGALTFGGLFFFARLPADAGGDVSGAPTRARRAALR